MTQIQLKIFESKLVKQKNIHTNTYRSYEVNISNNYNYYKQLLLLYIIINN